MLIASICFLANTSIKLLLLSISILSYVICRINTVKIRTIMQLCKSNLILK